MYDSIYSIHLCHMYIAKKTARNKYHNVDQGIVKTIPDYNKGITL